MPSSQFPEDDAMSSQAALPHSQNIVSFTFPQPAAARLDDEEESDSSDSSDDDDAPTNAPTAAVVPVMTPSELMIELANAANSVKQPAPLLRDSARPPVPPHARKPPTEFAIPRVPLKVSSAQQAPMHSKRKSNKKSNGSRKVRKTATNPVAVSTGNVKPLQLPALIRCQPANSDTYHGWLVYVSDEKGGNTTSGSR